MGLSVDQSAQPGRAVVVGPGEHVAVPAVEVHQGGASDLVEHRAVAPHQGSDPLRRHADAPLGGVGEQILDHRDERLGPGRPAGAFVVVAVAVAGDLVHGGHRPARSYRARSPSTPDAASSVRERPGNRPVTSHSPRTGSTPWCSAGGTGTRGACAATSRK
ncbi:hypothetical protein [Micromonospora deserti]|uniref:hypothetical protein n=1 Tax=Micromonospora deserti TaxID=2070366 RepID=UPI000DA9CAA0|nr:hypothetical protein [Micromonospora deserti]